MSSSIARATSSQTPDDEANILQPNAKIVAISSMVSEQIRIARFRGTTIIMDYEPFPHWRPLTYEGFKDAAYPIVGAVTHPNMRDTWEYVRHTAENLTMFQDYILFGRGNIDVDDEGKPVSGDHVDAVQVVWDMADLTSNTGEMKEQCIWRSPYGTIPKTTMFSNNEYPDRIPFIMDLACGDEGVYDDIMQSIAPMVMKKKPDGVIWWVGNGANGKSTLMDALHKIFPGQLASLTIHSLSDKRDAPSLNGRLANIVKESSEGRIDDTEVYKSIGTHEDFPVHTFNSQDPTMITGNMHHIFSGNEVPVFNDKGHSARRRTHIIPFRNQFDSDPTFEEKTFTPEFFGRLIAEMCKYAIRLKRQGYRYKFSDVTNGVKMDYDDEVNSAEQYAKHLLAIGVVAMETFEPAEKDYPNWCVKNGLQALGIKQLRRELQSAGFVKDNKPGTKRGEKMWQLPTVDLAGMMPLAGPGEFWLSKMYTLPGFTESAPPEPIIPAFHEPKQRETVPPQDDADSNFRPTKLKGEW